MNHKFGETLNVFPKTNYLDSREAKGKEKNTKGREILSYSMSHDWHGGTESGTRRGETCEIDKCHVCGGESMSLENESSCDVQSKRSPVSFVGPPSFVVLSYASLTFFSLIIIIFEIWRGEERLRQASAIQAS